MHNSILMTSQVAVIILAAGQGTRMRSTLPKVLHTCCGLPLVAHVVRLALKRRCSPIVVVVGCGAEAVEQTLLEHFPEAPLVFVRQPERRGTADAVRVGLKGIRGFKGRVLVLAGDVPLLKPGTIGRLTAATKDRQLGLLTSDVADPKGYGRVVREEGRRVVRIVEHRDATPAERKIAEINAGVYLCAADFLRSQIKRIRSSNAQGEFYLTDLVAMAAKTGHVATVKVAPDEAQGVNDREQLYGVERQMRKRLVEHWRGKGVTFLDPQNTYLSADVTIGRDAVIGVGVQMWGATAVGSQAVVEGPTVLQDSRVGKGACVRAFSHLEGAVVGADAQVGPYARLRPGTRLAAGARVGNFVELKKTRIGKGSKVNHLTYLGDTTLGDNSNVGAGTITCNYDGVHKHQTNIEDGVFVGSNSTLVAPVHLGHGAYVAAGSTVTQDVPVDALAFGRARQVTRIDYGATLRKRQRRVKREKKAKGN